MEASVPGQLPTPGGSAWSSNMCAIQAMTFKLFLVASGLGALSVAVGPSGFLHWAGWQLSEVISSLSDIVFCIFGALAVFCRAQVGDNLWSIISLRTCTKCPENTMVERGSYLFY